MRNLKRASLVSLVSVALLGTMALPANAADAKDTTVTVEVQAGVLSIAVPGPTAASSKIDPGMPATIALTGVGVSDLRAGTADWVATATLGALTGELPLNVMTPDVATYTAGDATPIGTATVTNAGAVSLKDGSQTVQSATGIIGNNTASWGATLTITAPAQALADTYTATLTHSVS